MRTDLALPLTCGFQSKQAGNDDVIFCTLPQHTCAFQRLLPGARAGDLAVCSEPHCVPTDWQVVTLEALPGNACAAHECHGVAAFE